MCYNGAAKETVNPTTRAEPSTPPKEDDYMATAACMRMLEFVLYSNGGMEEHKFTIWSTFKTLHPYLYTSFLHLLFLTEKIRQN